jgi:hypothetical protein
VTRSAARSRAPPVTNPDRISTSVVVTIGPATTSSSALRSTRRYRSAPLA